MTDMAKKNQTKPEVDNQDIKADDQFTAGCGGNDGGSQQGDNVAEGGTEQGDNSAEVSHALRQAEEWKDKYLRLQAEFDNYRKRTLKEKMELVALGGEDVISALLPVLDDMDRALDAMVKTEDIESVRTGIALVSKKLKDALSAKGLSEIEAVGNELDTDLHEAVAKIPADKKQRGRVVDVLQKGYKLKDKVVRHAKCVVGE